MNKIKQTTLVGIDNDLCLLQQQVYDVYGMQYSSPVFEAESVEYSACRFTVIDLRVAYRAAKITPIKTGQFVTLWKRNPNGPIEPFDITDPLDIVIIAVRQKEKLGQFVFPVAILNAKGIISGNDKEGKRAFRVYPPWDTPINKQAKATQNWQLEFYFEILPLDFTDKQRLEVLYKL